MFNRTVSIVLEFIDNASGAAAAAAAGLQRSFAGMGQVAGQTAKGITGAWSGLKSSLSNMWTQMTDGANKWASAFAGAAVVGQISDLIGMAAKFERFGKAAEFMTGSAEAADKFAASVRALAKETMFNVDQIAEMESKLVGNTKDVALSEKALRALTEAVAATGGGYSELEGATRAWIQMNSKAKVSSEELNRQFANANIPIVRLLAESIVKDLNHPLREYIKTAGSAGGASKALTKEYDTASGKMKYLGEEVRIAEAKLKSYTGNSKIAATTIDSLKLSIQKKKDAMADATGTIDKYNSAQKTTASVTKLTIDSVMAQLQEIGDLNIPGKIGAEAVSKALMEAYGGANKELIKTFDGQMSLLKDTLKLTALSFMGLDDSFRPVKGGLLDMLKNALAPVLTFLNDHQKDLVAFAEGFSKSVPAMMGAAGALVGLFIPAIMGLIKPLLTASALWGGWGILIGALIALFIDFGSPAQKAADFTNAFSDSTKTAAENTKLFNETLAKEKEEAAKVEKHNRDMAQATDILNQAMDTLSETLGGVIDVFKPLDESGKNLKLTMLDISKGASYLIMGLSLMASGARLFIIDIRKVIETLGSFWAYLRGDQAAIAQHNKNLETLRQKTEETTRSMVENVLAWQFSLQDTADKMVPISSSITGQLTYIKDTSKKDFDQMAIDMFGSTENMKSSLTGLQSKTTETGSQWGMSTQTMSSDLSKLRSTVETETPIISSTIYDNLANSKNSSSAMSSTMAMASYMEKDVPSSISAMLKSVDDNMPKMAEVTQTHSKTIIESLGGIVSKAKDAIGWFDMVKNLGSTLVREGVKGILGMEHGGIVQGPIGQPVPIIAHGGERVVPRSGVESREGMGGGAVSINFYGGVQMDSASRVDELAYKVSRILGRQSELARYGAGY